MDIEYRDLRRKAFDLLTLTTVGAEHDADALLAIEEAMVDSYQKGFQKGFGEGRELGRQEGDLDTVEAAFAALDEAMIYGPDYDNSFVMIGSPR